MWASWLLAMPQSANTFLHLLWQITSFFMFNRLCLAQINFKSDFSQVLVWPSEPYTIWYWKVLNSALSAVLEVIRSGNLSTEALHDCSSAGQLHVWFFFDCQPIGPCLVCFVFILKGDRSGETWRISGPWIWTTTGWQKIEKRSTKSIEHGPRWPWHPHSRALQLGLAPAMASPPTHIATR